MTCPDARSESCDASRHTLLAVQEEGVRLLTRKIVERAGFMVLAAARPDEADAMFRDRPGRSAHHKMKTCLAPPSWRNPLKPNITRQGS